MENIDESLMVINHQNIREKIYTIRGLQVMLDSDLAELYNVSTKRLNEQIKRNIRRFPDRYMFQLRDEEYQALRSQIATLKRGQHRKYLPYVFTEHGVIQLSSVLNSETAVNVSVDIIDAFIEMRKFLYANAQIFQRLDNVEKNLLKYKLDTDKKIDEVFNAMQQDVQPKQGIFFDGQVFDAYKFVVDLIRKAKKSIIVIDNFIDDRVFSILNKRNKNVSATIYTKNISKELLLDLHKHNAQYPRIILKEFKNSHDRFVILDDNEVYLVGSSLKDLGSKWFGFSKIEIDSVRILDNINKKGFNYEKKI